MSERTVNGIHGWRCCRVPSSAWSLHGQLPPIAHQHASSESGMESSQKHSATASLASHGISRVSAGGGKREPPVPSLHLLHIAAW